MSERSLSEVLQRIEKAGDADPLADKSKPPLPVTVTAIKKNTPAPGKFWHMEIRPGHGGYPGATIAFDHPVDFSKHDVFAVWFRCDTPVSYFQLVLNGTDGVTEDLSLSAGAARYAAFVRPGVWHLAFIPFKAEPGWVRFGKQMNYSKIRSLTFYTNDDILPPQRATYNFDFGGAVLYGIEEAKTKYAETLSYPLPATAARIASGKDVRVWTADAGEKIFKDTPFPMRAPIAKAASAKAAGHEYASLLWIVRPSRELKEIEAEAGDLVSDSGRIAATNVALRYVDFILKPLFSSPDLLPLLNRKRLRAAKDENLMVWATVYVPTGTPKGTYRGDITLKDAGGLSQRLPIQLEVYGFSLPVQNHLKSLFTIQHLYGGPEWMKERSERYWGRRIEPFSKEYFTVIHNVIRDYGEHRITPELFRYVNLTDDEKLALHRRYGFDPVFMIYYNLVNPYLGRENMSGDERAKIVAVLKEASDLRRTRDEVNLTAIKIADEPTAEHMKAVHMAAEDAKATLPDIQSFIAITSPRLPESLLGLVDTWCSIWGVFDFEGQQAQARKAAGDRFWTYAAEYRANDAYEPLDLRVPFWLYWKYGISGFHYSHHIHGIFLTYPNDTYPYSDGLEQIPSIRWEMIRHGLQDYEYLWLLNDLIQKAGKKGDRYRKLLQVPKTLAENDKVYTRDPRDVLRHRDRVAQAIEALSH